MIKSSQFILLYSQTASGTLITTLAEMAPTPAVYRRRVRSTTANEITPSLGRGRIKADSLRLRGADEILFALCNQATSHSTFSASVVHLFEE